MLRKARANIVGLVQLCDELTTGKASTELALKKALENIGRLNRENSDMGRKIASLDVVADQRGQQFRENERLLMELTNLKEPQPSSSAYTVRALSDKSIQPAPSISPCDLKTFAADMLMSYRS